LSTALTSRPISLRSRENGSLRPTLIAVSAMSAGAFTFPIQHTELLICRVSLLANGRAGATRDL